MTNFEAVELQKDIFINGELVYELPSLAEIQSFVQKNLDYLWDEYKRILNPEEYPVDLSEKCWNNKMKKIQEVRDKIVSSLSTKTKGEGEDDRFTKTDY